MRRPPPSRVAAREHLLRGIPDDLIKFSFRLMRSTHKFGEAHVVDPSSYLRSLLLRLQVLSSLQVREFRAGKGASIRAHRLQWERTTEPQGIEPLGGEWDGHEAWQFQLSANKHGRIHGILVDDVFYIVWLDPEHRLYQ